MRRWEHFYQKLMVASCYKYNVHYFLITALWLVTITVGDNSHFFEKKINLDIIIFQWNVCLVWNVWLVRYLDWDLASNLDSNYQILGSNSEKM